MKVCSIKLILLIIHFLLLLGLQAQPVNLSIAKKDSTDTDGRHPFLLVPVSNQSHRSIVFPYQLRILYVVFPSEDLYLVARDGTNDSTILPEDLIMHSRWIRNSDSTIRIGAGKSFSFLLTMNRFSQRIGSNATNLS